MTKTWRKHLGWEWLVPLFNEELARHDVAAVNLACAAGLPGADEIDTDYCLYKLDEWAGWVKDYANQLFPQFRRDPELYENSEAYFRTPCMIISEWLAVWVGAVIGISILLSQLAAVPYENDVLVFGLIAAVCGGLSASVVEAVGLIFFNHFEDIGVGVGVRSSPVVLRPASLLASPFQLICYASNEKSRTIGQKH